MPVTYSPDGSARWGRYQIRQNGDLRWCVFLNGRLAGSGFRTCRAALEELGAP